MKIDKNNYEAFFLDFVEGRLDNSSTLEMLSFLRRYPELKEELENYSNVKLEPSKLVFEEKDFLKKIDFKSSLINQKNFDDYCIAFYEKLLSESEKEKFFSYLEQNPEKKSDFQQYGKTILKADTSIVFDAKPFLKKKSKKGVRTILILRWTAVAAGIALAVSIFYKSPVKDNILVPKENVVALTKQLNSKSTVTNTKEELTITHVKAKKSAYNVNIINTADISANDHASENEDLYYLRPISIISVKGMNEVERPEFVISAKTEIDNEPGELELFDYAGSMIKEKLLKQNKPRKKLTLWDIADVTLKGYNHISEKDIILHRETDEKGKLTALAIETENRKYGIEAKN